jgi:prephenate dehydrogenase
MEDGKLQSMKIGIVGLGLIGGSIARALRVKAGIHSIEAVDMDAASLNKAMSDRSISGSSMELKDLQHCDLIYICVPVGITVSVLDQLSQWYTGIVTDVASTKERIVSYVGSQYPAMRFVGGHPMAGSEKIGYSASKENLFENAPYILCPMKALSGDKAYEQDFQVVRDLSVLMSAVPVEMNAGEHDAAVGLISHLPHVVAYSLVDLVRSRKDERLKAIAAGGFRDITRIASSDPSLWADILCDSGDKVAELLENYIEALNRMKGMLLSHDKDSLLAAFAGAKAYRDQLPLTGFSGSRPVQLWVEVDDKPGMIGRIAVLFGDRGINIKNMNIQDNRAYEGGSLRITLSSSEDARLGAELLQKENLTVRIVE